MAFSCCPNNILRFRNLGLRAGRGWRAFASLLSGRDAGSETASKPAFSRAKSDKRRAFGGFAAIQARFEPLGPLIAVQAKRRKPIIEPNHVLAFFFVRVGGFMSMACIPLGVPDCMCLI